VAAKWPASTLDSLDHFARRAAREAAGCPLDFANCFSRSFAPARVDRRWKSVAALPVHKIPA
jgi:hypothetical protein